MPLAAKRMNAATSSLGVWPASRLENIEFCPICRDSRSERLYSALTDSVCRCAPGEWSMQRCKGCQVAYLNPRPTCDSIGLAYGKYYTHQVSRRMRTSDLSPFGFLKTAIKNDYLKFRFGVTLHPRFPFGILVVYLMPYLLLKVEQSIRHLPPANDRARLLDVGCGNGDFIEFAASLGWNAQGLDPDPEAVIAARKAGLTVAEGGFPNTGVADEQFDVVTLNHVIEHVHDPIAALSEVHRILRPGGKVWIATPNLDSAGSRLFSCHWRGLEPPRHLTIFNASSLKLACESAGFATAVLRRQPPSTAWYFETSLRIRHNLDPNQFEGEILPLRLKWYARWVDLKAFLNPAQGEEIVIIATKP